MTKKGEVDWCLLAWSLSVMTMPLVGCASAAVEAGLSASSSLVTIFHASCSGEFRILSLCSSTQMSGQNQKHLLLPNPRHICFFNEICHRPVVSAPGIEQLC